MGGENLGSDGDGFVIVFGLYRVVRVFLDLKCVESVCTRWESGKLHVGELAGVDSADGGPMVDLVWQVHEEGVGAGVRVLCRVNSREVPILHEDKAMRR